MANLLRRRRRQAAAESDRQAEDPMNISEACIRRPVMTILVMLSFVAAGIFGWRLLPVAALPTTDFPVIAVSATLPGASPETMATSVATPLERQFSTIAGISAITSTSQLGRTSVVLEFDLDRNIDGAALDVQAALTTAVRRLPIEMTTPPGFQKVNPADQPVMILVLTSDVLPNYKVYEYADTLIAQKLSTLKGVAQVAIFSPQKFTVRVRFDPDLLAAKGIGFDEIRSTLTAANSISPLGAIQSGASTFTIDTDLATPDAGPIRDLIVAWRNGAPVKLGDVAKVENSVQDDKSASWFSVGGEKEGRRSIAMGVLRQPGANTVEVVQAIRKMFPVFEQQLPPSVKLSVMVDRAESIQESVRDVELTLIATIVLVILVIFLFLRRVRATLIPALALPISLIGTFAGMYMLDFSINNLTLLALTLSVGFVVDDAIVMLENIVRHTEEGKDGFTAALVGSKEIGTTIVTMTVSLVAVFIPVLFMPGIVGRIFNEFAVTITMAILISGIVSLTLTPMLSARMLGEAGGHAKGVGRILEWSEKSFEASRAWYARWLETVLVYKRQVLWATIGTLFLSIGAFAVAPKGFFPTEDIGLLFVATEVAQDSSFESLVEKQQKVADIIRASPHVARFNSIVGGGSASNNGRMFVALKPRGQRADITKVLSDLRRQTSQIPGIGVFIQPIQNLQVGGRQSRSLYQYVVLGLDTADLYHYAPQLYNAVRQVPGAIDVATDLQLGARKAVVDIDREEAARLGVPLDRIRSTLFAAYGSAQVTTMYTSTNDYPVLLEADPKRIAEGADAITRLFVKSNSGKLVPLSAVAKLSQTAGPLTITHLAQQPAVTISFNLAPGASLGDVIDKIQKIERDMKLPSSISTTFSGSAQAFQSSSGGTLFLLLGALLVIYIVLGILYESFIHPITILSGLPSAGLGAVLVLWLVGMEIDVIAIIGIVMLVGIVKKNAIMMVDVALERRANLNESPETAIFEACLLRFRPIMMTTMAALMGALPIALGIGAGAELRQPLGVAVVGGLVVSQLLTLFITPVVYIYLERARGQRQLAAA